MSWAGQAYDHSCMHAAAMLSRPCTKQQASQSCLWAVRMRCWAYIANLCSMHQAPCLALSHRTARHSTARHSTARHGTARHGTARHSTARHSTARHGTAQHSTAQHSTARHSTAQHGTARHSTAQHSTAQRSTASRHISREQSACAYVSSLLLHAND